MVEVVVIPSLQELWYDIAEYPKSHRIALITELRAELYPRHLLHGLAINVLAKREDRDDILLQSDEGFSIVHLTWAGRVETPPFPTCEQFKTIEALVDKLDIDAAAF